MRSFSGMVGKILESVEGGPRDERIGFYFTDGTAAESIHMPDCCESVTIDRIEGDIKSVIGSPIIEAEETEESGQNGDWDHFTWTRQRIKTAFGEVTIVWFGESNGYYGETPYFQLAHGKLV